MAIALTAELLIKIGRNCTRFEKLCNNLKKEVLEFGRVFIGRIEDENYY